MRERKINRRNFLGTASAAGTASLLAGSGRAFGGAVPEGEKLAIDGGAPVRETPLGSGMYGPQFYDEVEQRELLDVLASKRPFRHSAGDSKVLLFEKEYAEHLGANHALGLTSGTTALMTAMAALEVGPGDEVILPAWTWYSDYDAVIHAGALPVFTEIDESFNMDPEDIEHRITPRTKVIAPSHLQGCPADIEPIIEIARKHNLRVLEDCAQCVGGRYQDQYLSTLGDIGIFSFQESKTITAGEGGALVTNDPEVFERAVRFHDVGILRVHSVALEGGTLETFPSTNFRMSEFTGAVLRGQLQKLEAIVGANRAHARAVREGIADLPGIRLRKQSDPDGDVGEMVFLILDTREQARQFMRALNAEGISARPPGGSAVLPAVPHIENKVTLHPDWPSFNSPQGRAIQYGRESCPRTIDILQRAVGVRMNPSYTEQDVQDIIRAIRKVYVTI